MSVETNQKPETPEERAEREHQERVAAFHAHRSAVWGDFIKRLAIVESISPLPIEEFAHAILTLAQREPILRATLSHGGVTTGPVNPLGAQRPIQLPEVNEP